MFKLRSLLISNLKDDVGYSLLLNITYYDKSKHIFKGMSPMKSIYITNQTNLVLMSDTLINSLHNAMREYNLEGIATVQALSRVWLSAADFSNIKLDSKHEIFNKVLELEKENSNQNNWRAWARFSSKTRPAKLLKSLLI